ncbi:hypothetical protein Y032_0131g1634 [Ancylostoma ceylanicum]|nr:hypothetical protein Y032_0131g1634 [Ancylostoma ceylanicum]
MINGVAYDNGVHVLEDTKQGVTQVEKAHIILQHALAENVLQSRSPSMKKRSLFDRMGLSPLIGRRRSGSPWK